MHRVLIVEDDQGVAAGLVAGLRQHGFEVELATRGDGVVERVRTGSFDAVILDLMLPGADGFEVLEQLRHRSTTPVLVLTARSDLGDRLRSFELGAVDYLCKPFWTEELVARLRVRLGVSAAPTPAKRLLGFGALTIDLDARTVAVAGEPIALTRTEFDLLAYLAQRPGRAVSRQTLVEQVLSRLDAGEARTVDAHVTRMRKKLSAEGGRIATVWGIGYRFEGACADGS